MCALGSFLDPLDVGGVSFMHWFQASFPMLILCSSIAQVGEGACILELFPHTRDVTSSKLTLTAAASAACLLHTIRLRGNLTM